MKERLVTCNEEDTDGHVCVCLQYVQLPDSALVPYCHTITYIKLALNQHIRLTITYSRLTSEILLSTICSEKNLEEFLITTYPGYPCGNHSVYN